MNEMPSRFKSVVIVALIVDWWIMCCANHDDTSGAAAAAAAFVRTKSCDSLVFTLPGKSKENPKVGELLKFNARMQQHVQSERQCE